MSKIAISTILVNPKIMVQVGFYMGLIDAVTKESDPEKATSMVFEAIAQKIPSEGKGVFYRELATEIAKALEDGEVDKSELGAIVQLVRKNIL